MNSLLLGLIFLIGDGDGCGIPLKTWLVTYYSIHLASELTRALTLCFVRKMPRFAQNMLLLNLLVTAIAIIGWQVMGNFYFWSDANDCGDITGTVTLNYFMGFVIFVGYLYFAAFFLICCIFIPGILIYAYRQQQLDSADGKHPSVSNSRKIAAGLNKMNFYEFEGCEEEAECLICTEKYTDDDQITALKCHESHFFHTRCLEQWIINRNNTCPICRALISDLT